MKAIKLTSKRQATLPAELCRELRVGPGDSLDLERRQIDGEIVWVIRSRQPDWSWLGAAKPYGAGKSHALEDIERSIEHGMARGARS